MRKHALLAALVTLGLLLQKTIVSAQEPEGCSFANPFHDGKDLVDHLTETNRVGFDGWGLHPQPDSGIPNIVGVDTAGPVYGMFPGTIAYAGFDSVGTGGNIVSVLGTNECQGWKFLISHDDDISNLVVGTAVSTDSHLTDEGKAGFQDTDWTPHNHLSVGYTGDKVELGLDQYYEGGYWWVNPIFLVGKTVNLATATVLETPSPEVLAQDPVVVKVEIDQLLQLAVLTFVLGVIVVVAVAIIIVIVKRGWKGLAWLVGTIQTFAIIIGWLVVIGPPPYELRTPPAGAQDNRPAMVEEYQLSPELVVWAKAHGIGTRNLAGNIIASSVCWSVTRPGNVALPGEECRKVDLLLLLGIDFTETSDGDVKVYDPTQPGNMGWEAVEVTAPRRWGREEGMRQLRIIWDIFVLQPEMLKRYPTAIVDVNGNGQYEPELGDKINVYGSSSTCIGRSQGLPTSIKSFSWGLIQDPNFTFDPWNDPTSSALFKAAHLANSYNGTTLWVRRQNATYAYNPGAAEKEWAIVSTRIRDLSDIPDEDPQITVTKTTVREVSSSELSPVLYATALEYTPLEWLLDLSRSKREIAAKEWGIAGDLAQKDSGDVQIFLYQAWTEAESYGCLISWGFAARPCKEVSIEK